MAIPVSNKSQVADAIMTRLATLTDIKYTAFDVVRLQASDFQDWELPAVQIIDLAEVATPEATRYRKLWSLAIEVIVGPTTAAVPNQKALWDLMQAVEDCLRSKPKLGLGFVVHLKLGVSSTDLHLMAPFYLGRIELTVDYYQGEC